jgi:hypothetical protein
LYSKRFHEIFSRESIRFQIISFQVHLCQACVNQIVSQFFETIDIAEQSATHKIRATLSLILSKFVNIIQSIHAFNSLVLLFIFFAFTVITLFECTVAFIQITLAAFSFAN